MEDNDIFPHEEKSSTALSINKVVPLEGRLLVAFQGFVFTSCSSRFSKVCSLFYTPAMPALDEDSPQPLGRVPTHLALLLTDLGERSLPLVCGTIRALLSFRTMLNTSCKISSIPIEWGARTELKNKRGQGSCMFVKKTEL